MIKEGENVNCSRKYEKNLDEAVDRVFKDICNEYLCYIPGEWNLRVVNRKISFATIRDKMLDNGMSFDSISKYYELNSSIETDTSMIELTINNGGNVKSYPLFIGEDKKQGTNDKRLSEGKTRQAVGNVIERAAKNFLIVSDYCFLCDHNFFPYAIFAHGCDFGDDITTTMKAKLEPYIGKINNVNPFFDNEIWWNRKGGTCFCQSDVFTVDQIYDICYKICKIGIEYYLKKFGKSLTNSSLEEEMCEASVAAS